MTGSWRASWRRAPGSDGRFRVLRPHARGGVGEVFVAEDAELHREVALKEIQPHHADHPDSRARFVVEAEITGGLEHPGIVPVYSLGRHPDGRPYYAMRLVKGQTLLEAIRKFHEPDGPTADDPRARHRELRRLLTRFVAVCEAIAYAHSRRVVHRDLKPKNILLGRFGETLVVNWGSAKAIDDPDPDSTALDERPIRPASGWGIEATIEGRNVGTPAYMPPEQAETRPEATAPAADIFGLGATLYHLLTGRAPFEADSSEAALRLAREVAFPPPRAIQPEVPDALEAVCLKAMAADARGPISVRDGPGRGRRAMARRRAGAGPPRVARRPAGPLGPPEPVAGLLRRRRPAPAGLDGRRALLSPEGRRPPREPRARGEGGGGPDRGPAGRGRVARSRRPISGPGSRTITPGSTAPARPAPRAGPAGPPPRSPT